MVFILWINELNTALLKVQKRGKMFEKFANNIFLRLI